MIEKEYSYKTRPQRLCKSCGKCCTMAVCRYTRDELNEFAKDEESEAKDFLNSFIPYEDLAEPREISSEYVDLIISKLKEIGAYKENEPVFLHCRYINKDNTCSIYKNRFGWCKRMPNHGWTIVPTGCGFEGWQFLLREQIKHNIRKLKEYLYMCEVLHENNIKISNSSYTIEELREKINNKILSFERFGAKYW